MSHPALQPHFATSEIPEMALLRAAIAWAHACRIRVEPTAPPVECASSHASTRWVRRDQDAIVDPIGAAILKRQPRATHLIDAAVVALSSTPATCEGIADGLAGEAPSQSWMLSPGKAAYTSGYLGGVELRAAMSTWQCPAHRVRIVRGESCPACLAGLS